MLHPIMKQAARLIPGLLVIAALAVAGLPAEAAPAQSIATGSLSTGFSTGNGCDGNLFDITPSRDLTVTHFDVNLNSGTDVPVEVYYKTGTHSGFEDDAGAWTQIASTTVNSNGTNNPTPVDVTDVALSAGQTYGFYIYADNYMNYYDDPQMASDANMSLDAPTGICHGSVFNPTAVNSRGWSGTVYYEYDGLSVNVPNLGLVRISADQSQPAYITPAGNVVRLSNAQPLWLPDDADNSGADTYIVTDIQQLENGQTWVALFVGGPNFVWVPLNNVTPLTPLSK